MNTSVTEKDIELLESLYAGRNLYQGELHDHASTGGTSDGKRPLEHWKGALEALEMDFAAILDHRQVRHMYLPEWDDNVFIGGSEPGTVIVGPDGEKIGALHYNMVFPGPEPLEAILEAFPEFEFTGGQEGHFVYPTFTKERFLELIDAVKAEGGFFVFPHPGQMSYGLKGESPEDWWFCDEVGIEAIYVALDHEYTRVNYEIWRRLLKAGSRMWACAGGDMHKCAHDWALTSIYAEEKNSASLIPHLRVGDFTAGPVGIRMCIGGTRMGGQCDFTGQRLVIGVGKFHKSVRNPEHRFRLDVWADEKIVCSEEISCEKPTYVAMDAEPCRFYRTEIIDVTWDLRIALGNPIWNAKRA
ncbi:MAG: hypothetical protein J5794_09280 [Lachnospiraceae bacterium]|nr:hypothetical protein [Lachnospiraceae bacterium]